MSLVTLLYREYRSYNVACLRATVVSGASVSLLTFWCKPRCITAQSSTVTSKKLSGNSVTGVASDEWLVTLNTTTWRSHDPYSIYIKLSHDPYIVSYCVFQIVCYCKITFHTCDMKCAMYLQWITGRLSATYTTNYQKEKILTNTLLLLLVKGGF